MVAPTLLDCWHVRDLQRFRAVLKGSPPDKSTGTQVSANGSYGAGSSAFSKSPHTYKEHSGPCPPAEVNRRDHLGRSVLHLLASSTEPSAITYLNALLSHPSVNVNLQDGESGYTPLHRALYAANLQIAIILLRRNDLDLRVKDFEGLTAFDLYNSTVAGTNPAADALSFEPSRNQHSRTLTQLFTWGSNRNYNLGLGDGDDRQLPDKITLRRPANAGNAGNSVQNAFRASLPAGKKFDRIGIKDVAMSRLHTVILTDEQVANVWVCGLGSNGRLGRSPQTQTSFEPLKDFNETARSVAVAQDHTLIITASGAVYSFGLNRFSQLGYTIEQGLGTVGSTSGKFGGGAGVTFGQPAISAQNVELDIQISPRRIAGPLKKEVVLGAACSKLHSAVFTSEGLYTWGTNTGQLGYDRSGTAVQVQPRKVTALAAGAGIQQVAASDYGTACLMEGGDVFVWHNDTHFRINFPLARFSSSISVFRPRQVQPKTLISKLSSSGNTFSALSDMGDLFTFNLEHPSEYGSAGNTGRAAASASSAAKSSAAQLAPKPQLLWSVRKRFTAVRDVAIGADGSVILCTESGHCFVRPRRSDAGGKGGGGKNFKFQQIPYLQRVVKVATSESGALAAIKADPSLPDVRVKGRAVEEALRDLLPHLKVQTLSQDGEKEKGIASEVVEITDIRDAIESDGESDDEHAEKAHARTGTGKYAKMALLILEAAKRWVAGRIVSGMAADEAEADLNSEAASLQAQPASGPGRRQAFYGPHNLSPPFGCDAFLIADGHYLPVHKLVLGARIPSLQKALLIPSAKEDLPAGIKITAAGPSKRISIVTLSNCSFVSALFLLHYIYSDDLPPIWVPSVGLVIDKELKAAKADRQRIQDELHNISERLGLTALAASVKASMPRPPEPTLRANMSDLFRSYVDVDVDAKESRSFNDVVLRFEDRTVPAHSVILRRSPFFAALFQPHWTAARWDSNNVIALDMKHLRWEVARIVLMHLYTDDGETLFAGCDADRSLEQYMDFLVEVMAAANELLLDKLKLVVSSLLRKRILAHTVGAVMTEADFYKADQLKDITMDYSTKSMEALLEGGRLNELDNGMIRALTVYVRQKQDEKLHRSFAEDRLAALVEKHREFYDDLDIPPPSLHLVVNKVRPRKGSGVPGVKSPSLLAQDSNRRQSTARFRVSSPASPDVLRPVGAGISQRVMPDDASEVFSMDEDEYVASPRRDSNVRAQGSPWASLSQVAHLSLDDAADKGSPSRPWKSRTVEAERKQALSDATASPALRPVDGPNDLRSIMALEQQRQQQTTAPPHLSNATTPSGSGTSTPVHKSVTPGFELSPISIAGTRLSQKERKRQQQEAGLAAAAAAAQPVPGRSSSVSSPWKSAASGSSPPDKAAASSPWSMKAAATTALALGTSHEGTPPLASTLGSRRPSAAPLQPGTNGQGSRLSVSDASPSPANSMGPTYTPMRMASKTIPKRTNTNEPAWSTPAAAPSSGGFGTSPSMIPPLTGARTSRPEGQRGPSSNLSRSLLNADAPSASAPRSSLDVSRSERAATPASPAQLTFAQIQEQQRLAIEAEQETIRQASAARRSFLDIQEEERQAEERRREEEKQAKEFEKWFAEESKRLQKEKKAGKSGGPGASGGGSGKGKGGQKKQTKQPQQQHQQSSGSKEKAPSSAKTGQDPPRPSSANGNVAKVKNSKSQEGGKKGGANKASGKQANADGTHSKNSGQQRRDASNGAEPHNKPSSKSTDKALNTSQSRASDITAAVPLQHSLPAKPTAAATAAANLSAAAPTFTPRQP
ncbi:hypothetical protein EX895_005275 [Sporisorium graminicola]|uniref:BTB domain-containing protein n=1 Tax=Sporisorium graminicola TaxID=280036 RepID=A0A4U7KMU8_9BASI|nr:hypothetical protein EX895_005275 [Sporisorium graminicola]TKY85735.1 hypothetical protein EX895_005275 [Sporisorium graminicola]